MMMLGAGKGRDGLGSIKSAQKKKKKFKWKSQKFSLTDQQEMRNINRLRSKHGRGERRWITRWGGSIFFSFFFRSPVRSQLLWCPLLPPFTIFNWGPFQERPNSKSFLSPSIFFLRKKRHKLTTV